MRELPYVSVLIADFTPPYIGAILSQSLDVNVVVGTYC
jgi:hypothetical protein